MAGDHATDASVHEPVIAAYMDAMKDAFTQLKRRYRPAFVGVGNHEDRLWRAAAVMLHEQGLDPYSYMQFAFLLFSGNTDDVFPRMVTSPKVITRYIEERPARKAELEIILRSQATYMKTRLDSNVPLDAILLDTLAPLSAVFRFAIAFVEKREDLMAKFKKDAEKMVLFEPLYAALLGDWLPDDVKGLGKGRA